MTNGDKIRAMTDEELLEFLMNLDFEFCEYCTVRSTCSDHCTVRSTCSDHEGCQETILKWLKEKKILRE